jgi:hypothetical protein
MLEKVKKICIKDIIEKETGYTFKKNTLQQCPFCGSGTGKNKSSAFNIKPSANTFTCYSCQISGSAIDFMMGLNKGWDERHAINYLAKDYLNIVQDKPSNSDKLTQIEKTIYAIERNSKQKARQYLKDRSINVEGLPPGSFFYDSYYGAVAFVDSEKKLINRRLINPEKGKPKSINTGPVQGAIYDKLYNPGSEKLFMTEGIINLLSIPECSSIGIFSTCNKVLDRKKLKKYLAGKHIVIAFDNDGAGNKCYEYYKEYILSGGFEILSLQRLLLPPGKDLNDLLKEGNLENYITKPENFKYIWKDRLSFPIRVESDNRRYDLKKHLFYYKEGCYFTEEAIQKRNEKVKLSNFLMESVYHLMNGTKDSRRIIKFQRNTGEIAVSEIESSELSLEKFKKIIRSISGKGLSFWGNSTQLEHILTYNYDREVSATNIDRLGYQTEHNIYCFADAVILDDNKIAYPDRMGIVEIKGQRLYLPPFSQTNRNNPEYQAQRKFRYIEGSIKTTRWIELIYKAYGLNGLIGFVYVILALYRDIIMEKQGFFPFLFLFGEPGTGKSQFAKMFLSLFGEPLHGISLLNSTDKGFARSLSQYNNALYYLKEYRNSLDSKAVNTFKTGYDGELYTMALKTVDNRTKTHEITSACMIDGNELPTSEAALFARMIVLHYEHNKFTNESAKAFRELLIQKEHGFCQVTRELLKYRPRLEKQFDLQFNETYYQLRSQNSEDKITDRQLRHITLLLVPVKLFGEKLGFPVSYEDYRNKVLENGYAQHDLTKSLDDITIFWQALAFKKNEKAYEIAEGKNYIVDKEKSILYIKLRDIYPYYSEYTYRNNLNRLDPSSLVALLTSGGNKYFIPSKQKARCKTYTKRGFGSCYMFKFEENISTRGIIINEVELFL